MYMQDWVNRLDAFLQFNEDILHDKGKVTAAIARRLQKVNLKNSVFTRTGHIKVISVTVLCKKYRENSKQTK